jgi:hypothetical protein
MRNAQPHRINDIGQKNLLKGESNMVSGIHSLRIQ